jgi:perosamine synthetase
MVGGAERDYVNEALVTEMLTWRGQFVEQFELQLANAHNVSYALSCSSGTSALHLALVAMGVRPGDEVIVPTLTYIATANAVRYCGGVPVFVDVDKNTWCMNADEVVSALTPKTVGVIPVHMYGNLCDVESLRRLLPPKVFIVEDAAQAIGAPHLCSHSDIAVFSFYGNKIITTGEGGAVLTNNLRLRDKVYHLRGQCVDPLRSYWHTDIGFNYRLSNIAAAIGCGQLESIDDHKARRARVWQQYKNHLENRVQMQHDVEGRAHWMMSIVLKHATQRRQVEGALTSAGIETRPIFPPLHLQAPYKVMELHPVSEDLHDRGLNVPTHSRLTMSDVREVCEVILGAL